MPRRSGHGPVIQAQPIARFDRCHLLSLAESSLRVETVYHVLDAEFDRYADTQHAIHLDILRRFGAEDIGFAFPARTVYMQPTVT